MYLRLCVIAAIVLSVTIITGCASGTPSLTGAPTSDEGSRLSRRLDEMGYSGKEPVRNIRNSRFHGWSYLDDYHLLIRYTRKRHYLVEFRSRCYEIRSAMTIGFKTSMNQVTNGDKVIVNSDMGGARECWIDKLYLLTQKPEPEEGEETEKQE